MKSVKTPSELRKALASRVVIADGAMGTMLQAADPSLEDFQGHEGCNEILNVSRPDVVRSVHDAYLEVVVDALANSEFCAVPPNGSSGKSPVGVFATR